MVDKKQAGIVNRALKNYGYEETLEETMVNMVDSMMFYDRNKELYDLFDKYDRGELNEDQIKMNLNLPIMMKIKKSSFKKNIEDYSIEHNLDM